MANLAASIASQIDVVKPSLRRDDGEGEGAASFSRAISVEALPLRSHVLVVLCADSPVDEVDALVLVDGGLRWVGVALGQLGDRVD